MIIFKNKHYYSFLLRFKYVQIDFDLFQEVITFKTTKSSLYSILFFKHFQVIPNSSFLIITLLWFIRKILIPFDYNTNKKFPTNVFQSVGKKISYQCFQLEYAAVPPLHMLIPRLTEGLLVWQ